MRRLVSFPMVVGAIVLWKYILEKMKQVFGKQISLQLVLSGEAVGWGFQACLAQWIGVVSGNAIFGPPLEKYWTKKIQEEAAAKEGRTDNTS